MLRNVRTQITRMQLPPMRSYDETLLQVHLLGRHALVELTLTMTRSLGQAGMP